MYKRFILYIVNNDIDNSIRKRYRTINIENISIEVYYRYPLK